MDLRNENKTVMRRLLDIFRDSIKKRSNIGYIKWGQGILNAIWALVGALSER